MKKRIVAALVAFVTATLGLGLVVATPAQANTSVCQGTWTSWHNGGTNWAQVKWCADWLWYDGLNQIWWQFQIDDTLTDGYAVHLEACSDDTEFYYPYSCHNVSGQYSPFWGLIVAGGGSGDYCPQSAGPVYTSPWPSLITPDGNSPHEAPTHLRVVKGRCEGGAYQNVASFQYPLWEGGILS